MVDRVRTCLSLTTNTGQDRLPGYLQLQHLSSASIAMEVTVNTFAFSFFWVIIGPSRPIGPLLKPK